MRHYGAVEGSTVYSNPNTARWHAQALIRLMVELRLHARDELREHTSGQGTDSCGASSTSGETAKGAAAMADETQRGHRSIRVR